MTSWIWCFRDSAPPLRSCSSYRMPLACLEMLWKHIQSFNFHLSHTITKVERHGGQLELGIFRVAHYQERVLLPSRDSKGGSDVTTALTDHACDRGRSGFDRPDTGLARHHGAQQA